MRRLLSITLLFALAASAGAADAPKPNTLTPKEIADGWILLWDGETTFGWRSPNDSQWTIADGMLAPQAEKPGLLVTTSPFRDYQLEFDFQRKPDSNGGRAVGCDADGRPTRTAARKVECNFPVTCQVGRRRRWTQHRLCGAIGDYRSSGSLRRVADSGRHAA